MKQKRSKSNFSLLDLITDAIDGNNTKIIKLHFDAFDAALESVSILLSKQREVRITIE